MSTIALRPSFVGAVRGEALKLSRQLSLWLTLAGGVVLLAVIVLAISGASNLKESLVDNPTAWAHNMMEGLGKGLILGLGILILIIGARLLVVGVLPCS